MTKLEELTGPLYAEKGKLIELMQVAYEENSLCSYSHFKGRFIVVDRCIKQLEEAYK